MKNLKKQILEILEKQRIKHFGAISPMNYPELASKIESLIKETIVEKQIEQEVPDDDNSCCTRFKQWQSQQIEMLKKQIDEQKTVSDEEIEKHFTTQHYDNKNGHHYRINKDRIFGAKWMRDKLNNK